MEHVEVLRGLSEVCRAAITAGDWKVDGACDPDSLLRHADAAIAALSAPQPPAEAQEAVCLECGQPMMHMGQVCYACSHPAEAQPGGDCGEAGHDEGRCGNASCTPPSAPDGAVHDALQRDIDARGVAEIRQAELDALTRSAPSAPVGVEWPLSLLRAGRWREVYVGHRCMRLEVTYDYATWGRLMEQVEAALAAQQGGGTDE